MVQKPVLLGQLSWTSSMSQMWEACKQFALSCDILQRRPGHCTGSLNFPSQQDWGARRWTMDLQPKLGLRRPHIVVTGRSFYGWNSLGKLSYQKDVWDSLQDNQYLSSEAVAYVIRSLLNLQVGSSTQCGASGALCLVGVSSMYSHCRVPEADSSARSTLPQVSPACQRQLRMCMCSPCWPLAPGQTPAATGSA